MRFALLGSRPARASLALLGVAAILAFGWVACHEPTQLSVRVTTDFECSALSKNSVALHVGSALPASGPATSLSRACSNGYAGTLVLRPSGVDGPVGIEVIAAIAPATLDNDGQCVEGAPGCIHARRSIRYLSGTALTIPIELQASCAGRVCDPTDTCVSSKCVPAAIDPDTCKTDCSLRSDAGPPSDGGVGDAGLPGNVAGLALGVEHSCALLKDGTVQCWGNNASGQLGRGAVGPATTTPAAVVGLGSIREIHGTNTYFTCALDALGKLVCWGKAGSGEIPNPAYQGNPVATPVPATIPNVSKVVVGVDHGCALSGTATLSCWCNYVKAAQATPTTISLTAVGAPIDGFGAGQSFSVLRTSQNDLFAFGTDVSGELPFDGGTQAAPVAIFPGAKATSVACGARDTIVTLADGGHAGWGYSNVRQLTLDTFNPVRTLTPLPALDGFKEVCLGSVFGCGIDASDGVRCWGDDTNKQLGPNGTGGTATPTAVGITAAKIACGDAHACAIRKPDGALVCWGANSQGQLGGGTIGADSATPIVVGL